jgi:hypothetical protein
MSNDDLSIPDMLIQRAALCLAARITRSDDDLQPEYDQQLRRCLALAKDGGAGMLFDEYVRQVKEQTINHTVWIDSKGNKHVPTDAEIDAALADILNRETIFIRATRQ